MTIDTGSYWSARPADLLSNLVTRRGNPAQYQLLLHVVLLATKANLNEGLKVRERRPTSPSLSDPDSSGKGQDPATGF